jgi:hypothetical protein
VSSQQTRDSRDALATQTQENTMASWIATSHKLPQEGDALLFVIEHRNIVLCGIYSACMFMSRWSCYSPADVSEWRLLDIGAAGQISVRQGPPSLRGDERKARAA